ncbi:MAG: hypothetical protein LUD25_00945, partial [Coriobacteriaceae bacterium]|nr:hypothetical protein [Coriobacteriaceae bacterium]
GDEAYVGDAGPQTAEAVYTPADTTYANTVTAEITIEVSPISIAGMDPGFTWTDPDEVPYAGYILSADITPPTDPVTGRPLIEGTDYTVTYYVDNGDGTYGTDSVDPKDVGSYVFYIDGIGNYCDRFSDEGGTFTITMGNPDPIAPTGLTATYGETLGDVILPRSSGDANAWGWTWDNPEASVGNVGGNLFDATYTPQDPNTQATVHEQLTVDVSPKPVELAWTTTVHTEASYIDGAYDWVYDGRSANLQATIADRYLVGEDTCTVTEYKDNTEKDAGMHMATAVSLDNENYTLSATTASCYYYIEHASVTIEIADATKTYGEDDPTFNYTVEGLADGESLDITCSRTDGDDPEREDAGVHNGVIVASYEDPNNISDNYTIATKVGSLIIERATFDEETKDDYWTVDTYAENYDGTAKTKAISGTSQYGVELVEGTDYTVTYNHNVDAGTAVITVTGQGNYSFMLTWTFEILPVDVIITCGNAEKTYGDADPAMPTYTVTPEDAAASLGTVTCSREKGEDAGEYDITASYTASGNYSVSVVAGTFTINPKPLDEADFTIDEGPYTYTGTEIEPAVTGIDQTTSKLLAQGTDYTVEYSDKVAVGTGTVTITCTGNYSGEFTLYFEIVASAFGEAVFDVEVAGDTYDGQPHEVTVTPAAGSDLQPYDPATDDGDYSYTITDADGTDYGTGPVTNAGNYTVTITGHGNYEGSTYTYEFTIAPA